MAHRSYSNGSIAEALGSSHRIKDAAETLGMAETALESRCRDDALNPLYEACAERGKELRGRRKKPAQLRKMLTWEVTWHQPGKPAVVIWTKCVAATKEEALEVAKNATNRNVDDLTVKEIR